jgi:DNA-binding transcriptional LysR family regulator
VALVAPVSDAVDAVEELLSGQRRFDPLTSTMQFSAAMSDYAMAILAGPLLRKLQEQAPSCSINIDFLYAERDELERQLLRRDILIGPLSFGLPGEHDAVFADELVCVVAAGNPALVDGALSARSLSELPRAAIMIPYQLPDALAMDSALEEIGATEDKIVVVVDRLLALPHVIAGSTMFSFMPSWLARRYAKVLDLVIADSPLDPVPMIEAVHWSPQRRNDPALAWLREVIAETCREVLVDFDQDHRTS